MYLSIAGERTKTGFWDRCIPQTLTSEVLGGHGISHTLADRGVTRLGLISHPQQCDPSSTKSITRTSTLSACKRFWKLSVGMMPSSRKAQKNGDHGKAWRSRGRCPGDLLTNLKGRLGKASSWGRGGAGGFLASAGGPGAQLQWSWCDQSSGGAVGGLLADSLDEVLEENSRWDIF